MAPKKLGANNNKDVEGNNKNKINKTIKNLFNFKKLKNAKFENLIYIKTMELLIPKAKVAFTQLK